jgi:hypothetical protein
VPLFALMRRRLTDDEVLAVARELAASGDAPVDGTSVGVAIIGSLTRCRHPLTPSASSGNW